MPKFVSRVDFVSESPATYPGALALIQRGKLWDALKAVCGLTDVDRVAVTATGALTVEQCGPLQVDATGGAIVLTLPASGAATDEARYEFDRIDGTANAITVAAAGADTIDGAPSVPLIGTMTLRLPAGSTVWRVHSISGATPAKAQAALGIVTWTTGMVMMTDDTVAPATWVFSAGSIGNGASAATQRANADTWPLFSMYWNTRSNTLCPVLPGGRGVSAAADFVANKTLGLPDRRGMVDVGRDDMGGTAANRVTSAGSGIAGATLGASGGAQNVTLTTATLASHPHGTSEASHVHPSAAAAAGAQVLAPGSTGAAANGSGTGGAVTGLTVLAAGGGDPHQNMIPAIISNKIIKL